MFYALNNFLKRSIILNVKIPINIMQEKNLLVMSTLFLGNLYILQIKFNIIKKCTMVRIP